MLTNGEPKNMYVNIFTPYIQILEQNKISIFKLLTSWIGKCKQKQCRTENEVIHMETCVPKVGKLLNFSQDNKRENCKKTKIISI